MKAKNETRGNWQLFSFCIECSLISVICQERTSEPEQYTRILDLKGMLIMKYLINFIDKIKYTLIRLKRNAYYEYLINCKDKIKYTLIEKIYYQQWKCLHGCFHYVWYQKQNWHLDLCRSPGNKFLRPFERKYEYCTFLYELFSFYKKVPFGLNHAGFF